MLQRCQVVDGVSPAYIPYSFFFKYSKKQLFYTGAAVGGVNGLYTGYREIQGATDMSTSVKRTQ